VSALEAAGARIQWIDAFARLGSVEKYASRCTPPRFTLDPRPQTPGRQQRPVYDAGGQRLPLDQRSPAVRARLGRQRAPGAVAGGRDVPME